MLAFVRQLRSDDEVVIEVTENTAMIVRLLRPLMQRVVIANPWIGFRHYPHRTQ